MANTLWEKIEAKFAELKTALSAKAESPAIDHSATIAAFQTQMAGFKTELDAKEKSITDLNATVAAHVATIATKEGEIAKLKAEAKTAGETAVDLVAATGVDVSKLPAAAAPAGGEIKPKASLREQWAILQQQDSVKAAEFFAANRTNPEFWK